MYIPKEAQIGPEMTPGYTQHAQDSTTDTRWAAIWRPFWSGYVGQTLNDSGTRRVYREGKIMFFDRLGS
jgi:hypothetical protein